MTKWLGKYPIIVDLYYPHNVHGFEARPVLLINAKNDMDLFQVVKITSVDKTGKKFWEDQQYELKNWKDLGLSKRSFVNIQDTDWVTSEVLYFKLHPKVLSQENVDGLIETKEKFMAKYPEVIKDPTVFQEKIDYGEILAAASPDSQPSKDDEYER